MRRRPIVPRKRRFFVACEGESEQGYIAFLQRIADEQGLYVHLLSRVMHSSGDPLAKVERAIDEIHREQKGGKPQFVEKFLLFDTDVLGQNPDRDCRMEAISAKHGLTLVPQDCCFEAFLLRHFPGHQADDPQGNDHAWRRLREVWPSYEKNASAQDIARVLRMDQVFDAARNRRHAAFAGLLRSIGFRF